MELADIVVLALIQGITEFLPISSSGHLVLWPLLSGHPDQGTVMDVAVHMGTLVAICVYFRSEVGQMFIGIGHILSGRPRTQAAVLAWLLALATIPAVIVGLVLELADVTQALRAIAVIGWATILGGVLLWIADVRGSGDLKAGDWGGRHALFMGLAQTLALIPGVSRSGITMTAARALGYGRTEAARLALLMSVPIIAAAGTLETGKVVLEGNFAIGSELLLGAGLSCLAALGALWVMMRMFQREWTMLPFVIYRFVLGALLLYIAYG